MRLYIAPYDVESYSEEGYEERGDEEWNSLSRPQRTDENDHG